MVDVVLLGLQGQRFGVVGDIFGLEIIWKLDRPQDGLVEVRLLEIDHLDLEPVVGAVARQADEATALAQSTVRKCQNPYFMRVSP